MKIAKQLTELIGNTPLLELTNYEKKHGLNARLAAYKLREGAGLEGKDRSQA